MTNQLLKKYNCTSDMSYFEKIAKLTTSNDIEVAKSMVSALNKEDRQKLFNNVLHPNSNWGIPNKQHIFNTLIVHFVK